MENILILNKFGIFMMHFVFELVGKTEDLV
jgi:hypothetical protein